MSKIYYDTSAMLRTNYFDSIHEHCVVPSVLYELEALKNSTDATLAYQVRRAIRNIMQNTVQLLLVNNTAVEEYIVAHSMPDNTDSRIIVGSLMDNDAQLITYDAAEALIARSVFGDRVSYLGTPANEESPVDEEYNGWRKLYLTEQELLQLYENPQINRFHLYINEYAKIYNGEELVDVLRWDGTEYTHLDFKDIRSHYMGNIRPLDMQQKMLFDMLQNKDIKVQMILGKFGCGKSFIALAHAIDFVQRGLYQGIIFIRNNYYLKDTKDIGALPG